jgi:hypothetical protein
MWILNDGDFICGFAKAVAISINWRLFAQLLAGIEEKRRCI